LLEGHSNEISRKRAIEKLKRSSMCCWREMRKQQKVSEKMRWGEDEMRSTVFRSPAAQFLCGKVMRADEIAQQRREASADARLRYDILFAINQNNTFRISNRDWKQLPWSILPSRQQWCCEGPSHESSSPCASTVPRKKKRCQDWIEKHVAFVCLFTCKKIFKSGAKAFTAKHRIIESVVLKEKNTTQSTFKQQKKGVSTCVRFSRIFQESRIENEATSGSSQGGLSPPIITMR
jgi:hypothetical protein